MTKIATKPHKHKLQNSGWFSNAEPNHAVHFYDADKDLLTSLVEYFKIGFNKGDTCLVIGTPNHLISLNAALRTHGIDIAQAIKQNQYLMFDADEILATFMVSDLPNNTEFLASIGRMISLASGRGKPIRAFGEMVALLWEENNLHGVMQLEKFWHDLVKTHSLSLYCAYPKTLFDDSSRHKAIIDRICSCHSLAVGINQ